MRVLIIMFIASIVLSSCEEIIAEDITGTVPVLILPQENDTVQLNPVHFKWQEIEGAEYYHLMVVSPDFAGIQS